MTDFNLAASSWDEHPERRNRSEEIAAAVLERVRPSAETTLLEFGCGTGVIALALQPLVRTVLAADTAQGMLDAVKRKADAGSLRNVRTHLLTGLPGEALPACDLIVSSMTLHHIEDPAELFVRFFAALNCGGTVALADLEEEGGLFHPDPTGVFHNGFAHAQLEEWLCSAGFTQIEFCKASRMRKLAADGVEREFSIFLVVAQKPAA